MNMKTKLTYDIYFIRADAPLQLHCRVPRSIWVMHCVQGMYELDAHEGEYCKFTIWLNSFQPVEFEGFLRLDKKHGRGRMRSRQIYLDKTWFEKALREHMDNNQIYHGEAHVIIQIGEK